MRVGVTRLDDTLPLPHYASEGAAGFDLFARVGITIEPHALARIPVNVVVAVPEGHFLLVTLRSSTPERKGLLQPHGIGIIDSDYRGPADEVQVLVYNFRSEPSRVERGERIAQGLFVPVERFEWEEIGSDAPSRGGFGSTG